ncbi:hypothetical protein KCP78_20685 [Salmonella enterica subsp. enterica]|nr:hypothetical protein KCP78_20685 [Salmonella enterica subsp. enterica]
MLVRAFRRPRGAGNLSLTNEDKVSDSERENQPADWWQVKVTGVTAGLTHCSA